MVSGRKGYWALWLFVIFGVSGAWPIFSVLFPFLFLRSSIYDLPTLLLWLLAATVAVIDGHLVPKSHLRLRI